MQLKQSEYWKHKKLMNMDSSSEKLRKMAPNILWVNENYHLNIMLGLTCTFVIYIEGRILKLKRDQPVIIDIR